MLLEHEATAHSDIHVSQGNVATSWWCGGSLAISVTNFLDSVNELQLTDQYLLRYNKIKGLIFRLTSGNRYFVQNGEWLMTTAAIKCRPRTVQLQTGQRN